MTTYINIDDVDGMHGSTFVGKGGSGVMNIEYFSLWA